MFMTLFISGPMPTDTVYAYDLLSKSLELCILHLHQVSQEGDVQNLNLFRKFRLTFI